MLIGFNITMLPEDFNGYFEPSDNIILADEASNEGQAASNLAYRYSNRVVVFAHAHESGCFTSRIYVDGSFVDIPRSFEEIVEKIRTTDKWHPGKEIILVSCYAGVDGSSSLAQRLADALDTKVIAPAGAAYVGPNGELVVSEFNNIQDANDPRINWENQANYWFTFYGPSW